MKTGANKKAKLVSQLKGTEKILVQKVLKKIDLEALKLCYINCKCKEIHFLHRLFLGSQCIFEPVICSGKCLESSLWTYGWKKQEL